MEEKCCRRHSVYRHHSQDKSRDGTVSVVTRLRNGRPGHRSSIIGTGRDLFFPPRRPDQLWHTLSVVSSVYLDWDRTLPQWLIGSPRLIYNLSTLEHKDSTLHRNVGVQMSSDAVSCPRRMDSVLHRCKKTKLVPGFLSCGWLSYQAVNPTSCLNSADAKKAWNYTIIALCVLL
jgi:hypothetical protein